MPNAPLSILTIRGLIRVSAWIILAVVTASCGSTEETVDKRGENIDPVESRIAEISQDSSLRELPSLQYKGFSLCPQISAIKSDNEFTRATTTQLCGGLLDQLRQEAVLYTGKNQPDVVVDLEVTGEDTLEISFFLSMQVQSTNQASLAFYRQKHTAPETLPKEFELPPDLVVTPVTSSETELTYKLIDGFLGYVNLEMTLRDTIVEVEPGQTTAIETVLSAGSETVTSVKGLTIINQIGLNRSEIISHIRVIAPHGGDAATFKVRYLDGWKQKMMFLYKNSLYAYLTQ